jgi:hypothetical protein
MDAPHLREAPTLASSYVAGHTVLVNSLSWWGGATVSRAGSCARVHAKRLPSLPHAEGEGGLTMVLKQRACTEVWSGSHTASTLMATI